MSNKHYSEHFKRFVIEGEKFDFDSFKTQEEFESYEEELQEFLKMDDAEVMRVLMRYKNEK